MCILKHTAYPIRVRLICRTYAPYPTRVDGIAKVYTPYPIVPGPPGAGRWRDDERRGVGGDAHERAVEGREQERPLEESVEEEEQ